MTGAGEVAPIIGFKVSYSMLTVLLFRASIDEKAAPDTFVDRDCISLCGHLVGHHIRSDRAASGDEFVT